MASSKKEIQSKDGSWKLVVEASSVSLFVYNALIASARVYKKSQLSFWDRLFGRSASWSAFSADTISASGSLTSKLAPGIRGPVPGSPDNRTNSSVAECKAWWVFIGIKIKLSPTFEPTGVQPSADFAPTADGIIANGNARVGTETISITAVILS